MSPQLDQDALLVKSRYFMRMEHSEDNLRKIKRVLEDTMFQEGYDNSEPLMDIFGPTQRRMAFSLRVPEPEPSITYRVKDALNKLSQRAEERLFREHFFEWLEGKRNDVPFEFRFHFWEDEPEDGVEGYDVEVVAKPVLLQKAQQGFFEGDDESVEEADIEAAVATCKQRITEVIIRSRLTWERSESVNC